MAHRLRPLALALCFIVASCGDSGPVGEEGVVDFSCTWVFRLDFSYPAEDVFCAITDISLTVVQNGTVLSGGATGGTQACSQTGTDWPEGQIVDQILSGRTRSNSAVFSLKGGGYSLSLSGLPRSGRFDGTFQGNAFLDPFDVGDVTVSGTWSASR